MFQMSDRKGKVGDKKTGVEDGRRWTEYDEGGVTGGVTRILCVRARSDYRKYNQ